jgi:hypothetical protein
VTRTGVDLQNNGLLDSQFTTDALHRLTQASYPTGDGEGRGRRLGER